MKSFLILAAALIIFLGSVNISAWAESCYIGDLITVDLRGLADRDLIIIGTNTFTKIKLQAIIDSSPQP